MTDLWIGVDIGGTKVAGAVVDDAATILHWDRIPTETAYRSGSLVDGVLAFTEQLALRIPSGGRLRGIGVATGGVVDVRAGRVISANRLLPGWSGALVADTLTERFDVLTVMENDTNAFAVGEQRFGAGREAASALYLTIGTGVGGALTLGGELVRGEHGSAGEIGHIPVAGAEHRVCNCGRHGHLEAVASGPGMAETYRQVTGDSTATTFEFVVARARAGDGVAARVIGDAGAAIGTSLAVAMNLFDPARAVLGGGVVVGAGDLLWGAILESARLALLPGPAGARLCRSELGERAAVLGAFRLVTAGRDAQLMAGESR